MSRADATLYFAGNDEILKVGITSRPVEVRLAQMRRANAAVSVNLLATVPSCTLRHERAVHLSLQRHNVGGEWFAICETTMRAVSAASLASDGDDLLRRLGLRPRVKREPRVFSPALLKQARERTGLSAREVSTLSGYSPNAFNAIESGRIVDPGIGMIEAFAAVIGVELQELFVAKALSTTVEHLVTGAA